MDRFFQWTIKNAFKWLNRRGGKRRSFSWKTFARILDRVDIARPQITQARYRPALA
jgi:hypothetical protein